MVTVLKYGTTKEQIQQLLIQLLETIQKRGIKASRYCGKLKLKNDPLLIQKKLRDEWE